MLRCADDGTLRDGHGRSVALRGVNVGGRAKRPPHMPFDMDADASPAVVQERAHALLERVASWGSNVVRLPVSWHALEPARGELDRRYVARLAALLDAAHASGLSALLDFHQDLYAAPLGGNGFPPWALPVALRAERTPDHRLWFAQYALDPRVAAAYDHFWRDADDLQRAFVQMWQTLLDALGGHPAVIGVDLFNEPGWGSASLQHFIPHTLGPFYDKIIDTLHRGWPHLIYLYGGPGVEMLGLGEHELRPAGDQVVCAPHLYDPALLLFPAGGMSMPPARALARLARWRDESGTPAIITELGVTHGARDGARWLGEVADGLDRHHLSATIWEASASAALWHGEDLNLIGPDGADRPEARAWARPFLAALDGHAGSFAWDGAQQTLRASWTAAGVAPTLIRLPAGAAMVEHASAGALIIRRPGALEISAARGARVEIVARTT